MAFKKEEGKEYFVIDFLETFIQIFKNKKRFWKQFDKFDIRAYDGYKDYSILKENLKEIIY